MSLVQSLRTFVPLAIGLAVGGAGASLFRDSLPGRQGSAEERASRLEVELKRTQNRLAALEPTSDRRRPGRTLADGARNLAEDIREGRPVTPDDVFRASQPLLRDLAPLLDRLRIKEQQRIVEQMSGELARKYDLTPGQQQALKQWFQQKVEADAKAWSALVTQQGTKLEDLARAAREVRPDEGLDRFMDQTLSGDKLAAFTSERLAQRAQRVQQNADRRVERLDSIVKLDAVQRDQVFGIMAQASPDYDPAMRLEGVASNIDRNAAGEPQQAVLAVLRPDQRAAYETERQRRRDEAAKDLQSVGLTLPENLDLLEQDGF